jgi:hypothetical protein
LTPDIVRLRSTFQGPSSALARKGQAVKRAVALAEVPLQSAGILDRLRRGLARAGGASRDAVILDFLEDELLESQRALGEIEDYLARVGAVLREPRDSRSELFALAASLQPVRELEYLEATLNGLRRRLAQVAGRLPGSRR